MGDDKYSMVETEELIFHLDDSTTQATSAILYIEEKGREFMVMYNKPFTQLCYFDLKTKKCSKKIRFNKEGPNNCGIGFNGFLIDADSIYLYEPWPINKLRHMNCNAELIKHVSIPGYVDKKNMLIAPGIQTTNFAPISKVGDWIVLQGYKQNFNEELLNIGYQKATTLLLNTKNGELHCAIPYPQQYNTDNFWGMDYIMSRYCVSPSGDIITSLGADDSLRIYNPITNSYRVQFAGLTIDPKISPLAKSGKEMNRNEEIAHIYKQHKYYAILYDKWNELYYRFVVNPLKEINTTDWPKDPLFLSVIILDKDLNKVGEYDFPIPSTRIGNIFVSPKGIHINIESEDDDYMRFLTYRPVMKQE